MPAAAKPTSKPWSATNIVALVILVVTLGSLAIVFGDEASAPVDDDAEADLVAAYERSRQGTHVVEAQFTRTMGDGRQLQSAALIAQRPPDEVRWELGSVSGEVGGRRVNCTPDGTGGAMRCAPTGELSTSREERVAEEVVNLRSYFEGETPVYQVRRAGPGCFVLEQVYLALPDAPYGRETTMCFDAATGAMTELELRREGGSVDRIHAIAVRSEVTAADFSLDDWQVFQPTAESS